MKSFILIFTFSLFSIAAHCQDFWEVVELPTGIGVWDAKLNANNDVIIGTNRGVLCRRHDEIIWDTLLYLNNEAIGTIFIDKSNNIFGASRHLFYSDDNGENWIELFESPSLGLTKVFKNSVGAIFIGHWGGIYKCDTIGAEFIPVLSFNNSEVVNSIVEDTITGEMLCGTTNYFEGGGIYRSTDGGNNWVQDGLTGHFVSSLAFNSNGDLFAGTRGGDFGTGGVFKLPYLQSEWIQINYQELVTSLVINSEDEIFIGCSNLDGYGGVRYSTDSGITWESVIEGMGEKDIEELSLGIDEYVYAIARNSEEQLFKSIEPTVTGVQMSKFENEYLTFNYPNPFSEQTTIFFPLHQTDNSAYVLSIFNSCGIKVWEQQINEVHPEMYGIRFNSGQLSAGIYFYTLSDRSNRFNGKMIVLNN